MEEIETLRVPYEVLCHSLAGVLSSAGVANEAAAIEAEVMAEADLLGVPSHGVRMLPGLLQALAAGRVKASPQLRLSRGMGAICELDGDRGPGRVLACRAMAEAVARAGRFGVGVCLANNTSHWGRAHAYAARAARQGMIGICTTNGIPCMAVGEATGRIIGNNPLAIGIPRQDPERPVVLDMAMSQAAVGKVATWLREGRPVPDGWGLDDQGQPCRDARAILAGAVLPVGGHKGAGLALMMELLTAALGGGPFGHEIASEDASGLDPGSSKIFIAIDPAAFSGSSGMSARVERYLNYLHAGCSGASPYRWPGERGWRAKDENLRLGVPLHREIVEQLQAAGVALR